MTLTDTDGRQTSPVCVSGITTAVIAGVTPFSNYSITVEARNAANETNTHSIRYKTIEASKKCHHAACFIALSGS